jgi:hypothetical protein
MLGSWGYASAPQKKKTAALGISGCCFMADARAAVTG